MKWFSSQNIILILLLTSNFVTGQVTQPEEILGVNDGDTFNYVISSKFGIEGPIFTDGYNDLSLENGDTFNLTVLDTSISNGRTINLELWNQDTNVTYSNGFAFFDFVSYVDWDYTVSFLEDFNLEFYIDEETIHFTFFINSGNDEVTYFEYSYMIDTGILFHKFQYTAPLNNFQNPTRVLQIDLGNTPLPRPNIRNIGFEAGDFFIYNMIQLQGFENQTIFNGKNGTLNIEKGNQFVVTPLSSEPNSVHSIPLSFQSNENGIVYDNKLDFHNSVKNPSFFVYTDWEYVENIVKIFDSNADESKSFDYLMTLTKFIYKESFISADSYYLLELHYDLSTGVLLYESLVLENILNVSFGIIEFQLENSDNINQDKLSIDLDLSYNYKLSKYESTEYKAYFSSDDGNLWLFSGDTFSISPISSPKPNSEMDVYIEADDDLIRSVIQFDRIGSFFIYTDWEYWNNLYQILDDFSPVDSSYKIVTANTKVEFKRIVNTANLQIIESISYVESTGVLNYYSLEITGTDQTGGIVFTDIKLELENTTLQPISQDSEKNSNGEDGLIVILPFVLLSGVIIALIINQKRSK